MLDQFLNKFSEGIRKTESPFSNPGRLLEKSMKI